MNLRTLLAIAVVALGVATAAVAEEHQTATYTEGLTVLTAHLLASDSK